MLLSFNMYFHKYLRNVAKPNSDGLNHVSSNVHNYIIYSRIDIVNTRNYMPSTFIYLVIYYNDI